MSIVRPVVRPVVEPIVSSIFRGDSGTSLASQVAALFAAMSGPKLWLDPSDPATRFQDQAGTTLVTADGQPYGRANDKSGGGNHVGQVTTTSRPLWKTDGALSWAQPDGTDDSWQSLANLDLSSTDKVTVIAGMYKASDAAIGILAETGASASANDGTFALFAPSAAATPRLAAVSRGTLAQTATDMTAAAPLTAVVTAISDIAGASLLLRRNGIQTAQSSGSQGSGSFVSALLNIFRRNNASLPFNGRLYGLMIFGRLLTADELSLCERYMAQKSGVTL